MFCSKCGKPVPQEARFCPYCGASCVGRDRAEGKKTEEKATVDGQKKLSVGKKKKTLWLIPAAAVLLIFAIIGALFAARQMKAYQQYRKQLSLGERYMEELDYEAAIAAFEEAIQIDPKREEAYLALAELYEETGRPEKAVTLLEKALEQLGQSASDELISCLEKAADRTEDTGEADADVVWTEEGTSGTADGKADREEDKRREEAGEEPDFSAGSLFGGKLTDKYGTYFQYKNTYELDIYPDPGAEGKEPGYPNGVDVEGQFPFTVRDEWVSRQGETYVFHEGDASSPWTGVAYTAEDWTSSGSGMFFAVDTQDGACVVSMEQRWGRTNFYNDKGKNCLKKEEESYLLESIIVCRGEMLELEYVVNLIYDENGIEIGYGIYTPETRTEEGDTESYTSEFFTLYKSDGSGEYSSFEEAREALQRKWKELGLVGRMDAIPANGVHFFGMYEKNVPEQTVNEEGGWKVPFTLYSNVEPTAKEESGRTDRDAQRNIPDGAGEFQGHYYYVYDIDSVTDWNQAQEYCEERGGHLATITSAQEDAFLYSYMREAGYSSAMFGLSDQETENVWEWVTGEPLSYENWSPGEPNHQGGYEHYGMYYEKNPDGTWNDGSGQGGPFLCEWDGNREQTGGQWDRRIVGSWMTAEDEPTATSAGMQIMEDGEVSWNPARETLQGWIEGVKEGKIVTGSLTGSYYNNATVSWEENTWAGWLEMEYDEAQDVLTCWYYKKDSSVIAVYELRRAE